MTLTLVSAATPPIAGGQAAIRIYAVSNPAAGADWSVVVPAGEYWRVVAATFVLACNATVADRAVHVFGVWAGKFALAGYAPATQTAGNVAQFTVSVGVSAGVSQLNQIFPVADALLPPGSTFESSTANLQAGDQYSGVTVFVTAYS